MNDSIKSVVAPEKPAAFRPNGTLSDKTGRSFRNPPRIEPAKRAEGIPLSHAQEQLWVFDQLEPGNVAYNMPGAIRVRGRFEIEVLRRVMAEIVRRHEVLRTHFESGDEGPVQVIEGAREVPLEIMDLRGLLPEEQKKRIEEKIAAEARHRFDLARGPLFRVAVATLPQDEHILFFTLHHIVFDGWSSGILVREFVLLYEAFRMGLRSPLPELPVQYADYAQWQRQWLDGKVIEAQLSYWQEKLNGLEPLGLPTDRLRPPTQSFCGACESFQLSSGLTKRLGELCRKEGITLFMLLSAAFKVLLSRYTGREDIAIGTPIANRTRRETEQLIGFFVNTLLLRTDLSGNPTFTELLRRERAVAIGAYENQDVPFGKLLEKLQPDRDLSRSPLFQVMLVLQNAPQAALRVGGLEFEPILGEHNSAKFDITLSLSESPAGLMGSFGYSTDLYDAATIVRMIRHWETLLTQVAENPDCRILELEILTSGEKHQLLVEWNDTVTPYPKEKCLHELFEEQVERTPGHVAVEFEGQRLTYHQLNCRANQLARRLKQLGVSAERVVAIRVRRSVKMMVGLLAILKAGGAFVPLDPDYPHERGKFVLKASGAAVLLVDENCADWEDAFSGTIVHLDHFASTVLSDEANLPSVAGPENLAYIMFTSGSTGRPKGVMVRHQGLTNYVTWSARTYEVDRGEGTLVHSSFAFDLTITALFPPLLAGQKVTFLPQENNLQVLDLICTRARNLSLIKITPVHLEILKQRVSAGKARELAKVFVIGGEALRFESLEFWRKHAPQTRLINEYGPTETVVGCSIHEVDMDSPAGGNVPIGRPIANTRLYILGPDLNLVPAGCLGELFIGGDCLGRGYLGEPGLTAERFIPDSFARIPGSRLYRTGDLARRLPDGKIEFCGRVDAQVKIRGWRIELGEVEKVLGDHPDVEQNVVVVRGTEPENRMLVAYVVPKTGRSLSPIELRTHMRGALPDYMVPANFVILDALPLTSNGKTDLAALPPPGKNAESNAVIPPRSALERELVEMWKELLRIQSLSVHDRFFDIGGNSLLATQVISRVRELFQIELPLKTLFEAPTVAELAERIRSVQTRTPATVGIERISRDADIPLSHAQERFWILDQLHPGNIAYNVTMAVRIRGRLEREVLARTFEEIVRRHEVLRTTFDSKSDVPRQLIHPVQPIAIRFSNLEGLDESGSREAVAQAAREESERSFDLAFGPLMRLNLLRLNAAEHVLVLCLHHIIFDGWSSGVLVREFSEIYESFARGMPSPLPEPPVQYADYAAWQRRRLPDDAIEEQLRYWNAQLAEVKLLDLPADHLRPAAQSYRGAVCDITLPEELTARLSKVCREQEVTLFMLLSAALKLLLSRYTRQEDIAVGTPIANRNWKELEGMLGLMVNTLVLRTDLSGAPDFLELLRRERNVALDAYAHQDAPFERVVQLLRPERNLSHNPLFNVMFALQNVPREVLKTTDLGFEPVSIDHQTAKFDLFISLQENGAEVSGSVEYCADLFERETVERMIEQWQKLLAEIVAHPDWKISRFNLSLPDENRRLASWNDTQRDYQSEKSIHELFEEQVAATPDAIALIFEDQQMSYRQLDECAERVAGVLRDLGVGPDGRVGICMGRSPDMVIAMLAVLKAGGAYVPLDPAHPKDRLGFMIQDAKVRIVLTQQALLDRCRTWFPECLVIDIHAPEQSAARPVADEAADRHSPDNLAYVIFTSGSTGQPKGVMVSHRNVVNFFGAMDLVIGRQQGVWLAVTSISFDISVLELCWTLTRGFTVVIYREPGMGDFSGTSESAARSLGEQVRKYRVTHCQCTPSRAAVLLEDAEEIAAVGTLRQFLLGGEALPPALAQKFANGPGEIINLYGPTETTIWSTCAKIRPDEIVTIGGPIANTQVYIVNECLLPVAVNEPGELLIGGDGVARGYLNRPELTAERFIPNPFTRIPGARMYRTGDLARFRGNGSIEFLGRLDGQIKLRGHRIELGEIEATLMGHPQVRQAAVIVHERRYNDKQLAACVVPRTKANEEPGQSPEQGIQMLSGWQTIWDETYGGEPPASDPTFNITGWRSRYTGRPIPAEEMRDWVNQAILRIRELQPKRILEIGCGTGLLLFRLAPECEMYWATDFSPAVIRQLLGLTSNGHFISSLKLLEQQADDFRGIPADSFDTVILNSVVQYFPNVAYLMRVLEGAVRSVRRGGHIFIGDVRNLDLLEPFCASMELRQAPAAMTAAEFRRRVQSRLNQESELLLAPEFFETLPQHLPEITAVEIQLKRGLFENELTNFRYDVICRVGGEPFPRLEIEATDWRLSLGSTDRLRKKLETEQPEAICIRNVPNARLSQLSGLMSALAGAGGTARLNEVQAAARHGEEAGIDPENLWALGRQLGYHAAIRWSRQGNLGSCDVIFSRGAEKGVACPEREALEPGLSSKALANDPTAGSMAAQLPEQLRDYLKQQLPEIMIPGAVFVLNELPLTAGGKVDRRQLREFILQQNESHRPSAGPSTRTEELLLGLYREVLKIVDLGVEDSFFALAGHSLLAMQLISRIRQTMAVDLTLRDIYELQTVARLAERVDEARHRAEPGGATLMDSPESARSHAPSNGKGAEFGVAARAVMDRWLGAWGVPENAFPLTFPQQFLWRRHQNDSRYPLLHSATHVRFDGELDVARLENSLNRVIERHESLRIAIKVENGVPIQVVCDRARLRVEAEDLRQFTEAEFERSIESAAREEIVKSFDLCVSPVMRVKVLVGSASSVVLLSFHEIIADGWSAQLLLGEALEYYSRLDAAAETGCVPRAPQWRDVLERQRAFFASHISARFLTCWHEYLAAPLRFTEIPSDHPRPMKPRFRGDVKAGVISLDLSQGLHEVAQREHVTVPDILLAAFQILLSCRSRNGNVCIGYLTSGRTEMWMHETVGFLANYLAVRLTIEPNDLLIDVLLRTSKVMADCMEYQLLHALKLGEMLETGAEIYRVPLFPVLMNFMDIQVRPAASESGPEARLMPMAVPSSYHDLVLRVIRRGKDLEFSFRYNSDLFKEETIESLANQYLEMLESFNRSVHQRISTVSEILA